MNDKLIHVRTMSRVVNPAWGTKSIVQWFGAFQRMNLSLLDFLDRISLSRWCLKNPPLRAEPPVAF